MRRLSTLLVTVCILITVLIVPVCAADSFYRFDTLPSVTTLPVFQPSGDSGVFLFYPGKLPEGEYVGLLLLPGKDEETSVDTIVEATFSDSLSVVYGEPDDDGFCDFLLETQLIFEAFSYSVRVCIAYSAEDDITYFGMFAIDSDQFFDYPDGGMLILSPVLDDGDDAAPSCSSMRDVIVDLFGPYEQQTETVTQTLSDGSVVTVEQRIPGIAGLDYEWFAALGLFGLMIYCFFRLLGGVFK